MFLFWPVIYLVLKVISLLELLLLLNVLTRWAGADPNHFLVRLVRRPTDPLLELVRPLARKIPGAIDWSPAIALVGLEALSRLLIAIFK